MNERRRPGLAKTRGEPLVRTRTIVQARATDGRFRTLFESADTVTEGAVRADAGGSRWYGSTSIVLALDPSGAPAERAFLSAVASKDLHIRLRAVRAARREATLRAPDELGPSSCEIRLVEDDRGVRIDVDIDAPLAHASSAVSNSRPDRDDR